MSIKIRKEISKKLKHLYCCSDLFQNQKLQLGPTPVFCVCFKPGLICQTEIYQEESYNIFYDFITLIFTISVFIRLALDQAAQLGIHLIKRLTNAEPSGRTCLRTNNREDRKRKSPAPGGIRSHNFSI